MPRSRVTELSQRQSPRNQFNIRTSSSNSDPLHHRPRTERSPKLADGRSPRGSQSEPVSQKKLGTRITDLESQLGQAQEELKSLKNQLTSTEAAKKAAQDQLEKKSKKHQKPSVHIQENHSTTPIEKQAMNKKEEISSISYETPDDAKSTPIEKKQAMNKKESSSISFETPDGANIQQETDVFGVPVENLTADLLAVQDEFKPDPGNLSTDDLALKNDEIKFLMTKLDEKEKELEIFREEKETLKSEVNEKLVKISSAESEIEELTERMNRAEQKVDDDKRSFIQINERLEDAERAKEELENEMRRMRVQTEQWRKAADAAASVLAGVEMNRRRISERCGSMDKHYGSSVFEHGGYDGYVGSPRLADDDDDDVFGSGKRKGSSGMRMFGDLWKKKGQK